MEKKRTLIFYKQYFNAFFSKLPDRVQAKIDEVLYAITVLDRIPGKFFSHMTGYEGLYEIRVEYSSNIYRIFCCFDEGNLIVLFNAFQKKTQKTPPKEIDKAMRIKHMYFKEKRKQTKDGKR